MVAIGEELSLFSTTYIPRRIAIDEVKIPDLSDGECILEGRFIQIRDFTNKDRQVLINFDLAGRLTSIELAGVSYGSEVKILERSFDGHYHIYEKNCENIRKERAAVYYYYDYYNQIVSNNNEIAKHLVQSVNSLLVELSKCGFKSNKNLFFFKSGTNSTLEEIKEVEKNLARTLDVARQEYDWAGLENNRRLLDKIYPSRLGVFPPETRPDRNPLFTVIQITCGCWVQRNKGPCGFCNSYGAIKYREITIEELEAHIDCVKRFTGSGWDDVRKLFLADADPLHTKIDTQEYFKILSSRIPQAPHYESFVTTATILSRPTSEWIELKKKGLNKLYWGVESLDNSTLKTIGKPHTKDSIYKAADQLNRAGVPFGIIVMSGIAPLGTSRTDSDVVANNHVKSLGEFVKAVRCKTVYVSRFIAQENTKMFGLIASGKLKPLTSVELEAQHRAMIKTCSESFETCEVRGGYGVQFV